MGIIFKKDETHITNELIGAVGTKDGKLIEDGLDLINDYLMDENTQLKHENQMLKLKLQQIQNTLNYD